MMSIFVFDTRDLTEALFEARLNNMRRAATIWTTSSRAGSQPEAVS